MAATTVDLGSVIGPQGPQGPKGDTGPVNVDAEMSSTSTNPVQNKVINAALANKQGKLTSGYGIKIEGPTITADVDGEPDHGVCLIKNGNKIGVAVDFASTTAPGTVQLSDAVDSTSTTLAATAHAVKKAYDLAASKQSALTFATDDDINAMFA